MVSISQTFCCSRLGIIFLLQLAYAEVYVPGTPGAPWTEEEVLIVKSKLYSLFNRRGFAWGNQGAPRAIRLGFHDCLKYKDGTGGCDGCLNWQGMGTRFDGSFKNFTYENVQFGDNNGLKKFVEIMERIYTRTDWPKVTFHSTESECMIIRIRYFRNVLQPCKFL